MRPRAPSSTDGGTGPFPPQLSDIEVARMWRSLSATPLPLPRRRSSRPPIVLALAMTMLVAASAFGLIVTLSPKEPVQEVVALEPTATASPEFGFPDGSRLTLGPGARLDAVRMDQKLVEFALSGGAVDVIVNESQERQRFSIVAGDYDVVAARGHFRISMTGEGLERRLEVIVHGGSVEVHDPMAGATTQIAAGRAWSALLPEP